MHLFNKPSVKFGSAAPGNASFEPKGQPPKHPYSKFMKRVMGFAALLLLLQLTFVPFGSTATAQSAFTPVSVPNELRVLRTSGQVEQSYTAPLIKPSLIRLNAATITVTYTGFTTEAQTAYQYAVDIWQTLLTSTAPVQVNATWGSLECIPGSCILGQAGATVYYSNSTTVYPGAVANQIANSDLNGSGSSELMTTFNKDYTNWYFGTDGNTPANKTDFVTTVLHELGHGLGFAGSMTVSSGSGSWGSDGTKPFVYDQSVINGSSQSLINTALFANPSSALATQLQSNNIFFNGTNAKAANSSNNVALYAPSTFNPGSSYSHLAESFNGTTNALMTYSLGSGEAIHSPGAITLGMLKDMGWKVATVPSTPTGLTVTPVSSSQINLAWSDVSDETGYKIERKLGSGGTYAQIGTTAAGVVTYSDTGLATATQYYYRLRATNAIGDSSYATEVNATTTVAAPSTPTGLTATAISSSQINLSWTDVATETGYKIERKTGSGGTYAQIGTTTAGVVTFFNTGLSASTQYYYRVRATNAGGDSAYSTEANATTTVAAPSTPTGLTATATSSSQINLSWTDVSTETGYKVERKTGVAGTYAQIGTTAAGVVTYSDTGLTAATQYYYRIRASNAGGDSAYSTEANATTTVAAPSTPTNLTATSISSSQINLAWTDVASETGYKIERKTGVAGTYAQIGTTAAGVVTYNDTGLTASTQYYYRVRATNAGGDSSYSIEANATTTVAAPSTPTGLTATTISSSQINLSWTDVATETGYEIDRKLGVNGTYAQIGTTVAGVTTYSDTGLVAATQYYYRIRATNAGGDSANSTEVNATTTVAAPGTPVGLTATAISATQVNLSWTDVASETGYKVERKTGAGGTYAQIGTTSAGVVTYNDAGLTSATEYFYRIRANNAGGDSAYSTEANATTKLATPGGLTATAISSSQINLAWTDIAGETGYRIERKTGAAGTYAQIGTTTAGLTTYNDTDGLSVAIQYFYRVRAFNDNGDSDYSNEANATASVAVPATPTGLSATAVSTTQINLAWTDVASETGYKVERKTGAGGTYTQIGTTSAEVVTYNDTSLAPATEYFYRIRSYNNGGNSAYSTEANATTPSPLSPLVVTIAQDYGTLATAPNKDTPGTLSYALSQAVAVGGNTITFNLPNGGTTVAIKGPLPAVASGITISGGACSDPNITLDGSTAGASTNGLILGSGVTLINLIIGNFDGKQIVATGGTGSNVISCSAFQKQLS